jgi:hypothetical protein
MIRVFASFILLFIVVNFAIITIRTMTGKERWELAKTMAYGLGISIFVIILMASMVILF